MDNLAKNDLLEEGFPTILFEPSEFVDFRVASSWQKEWQNKLIENSNNEQAIWILQHYGCYTLGRGATHDNLLFDLDHPPLDLYRIDRGGEVTCHVPGQLVVYLVLDLHNYKTDLDWYLRKLENVVLDVLADLGLQGYRIKGLTGLWCGGRKIASIGIGCRRWITKHGIALNVNCDLSGFQQIIPCGLNDCQIGCLSEFLPKLEIREVSSLMKKSLIKHFGLFWKYEKKV